MRKFTDKDFFAYAFGPNDKPLTDGRLQKGLKLVAEKLVANKIIEGGQVDSAMSYMEQAHSILQNWIRANYNTTHLRVDRDFLTKSAVDFYKEQKHMSIATDIKTITTTSSIAAISIFPDMIDYYYKSGACIRNNNNPEVANLRKIVNFETFKDIPENTKNFLATKKRHLSEDYPTKEQFKEAYRDFLTANNAEGLDLDSFVDPKIGGQANPNYLTAAEKKDIAASIDSKQIQDNVKVLFADIFNIKPLTIAEARALKTERVENESFAIQIARYSANVKRKGDMLDKVNVERAISTISALKELHNNRPWYQRFFGYFGNVGKELTVVEQLKQNLINKGVDAERLERAINGGVVSKSEIINDLPTREERMRTQEFANKELLAATTDIQEMDDERINDNIRAMYQVRENKVDVNSLLYNPAQQIQQVEIEIKDEFVNNNEVEQFNIPVNQVNNELEINK